MTWWNIIKDVKTVSQTQGSFDFEEEEIPEKDEPNCKEKLIAIQQALANWRPAGTKYKGAVHTRGTDNMSTYLYQDKGKKEIKNINPERDRDWLHEGDATGIIISSNSQVFRELSEEQACEILTDLEEIVNAEPKQWWDGVHLSAKYEENLRHTQVAIYGKDKSRILIYFMLINGKEADFWFVDIGHQDESFGKELYRQAIDYLRQQVK